MVTCPFCGLENGENEDRCIHCFTKFSERVNFQSDENENMTISELTETQETIKEFSIKGFLENNHRLFTILGIFGGLSYYLTNLSSKTSSCDVCSILQLSNSTTTSIPQNIPPLSFPRNNAGCNSPVRHSDELHYFHWGIGDFNNRSA